MGALGVAIAVVLAAGTVRTFRVWGLPKAAEPFDVAAFEAEAVPDGRNAFVDFRRAKEILQAAGESFGAIGLVEREWATAKPEARAWVEKNGPALAAWKKGTERPDASPMVPGKTAGDGDWPAQTDAVHFTHAARLEAGRLEEAGDLAAAWGWHLARLRGCLLLARRKPFTFRWSMANRLVDVASRAQDWADRPDVTVPLLRRAIADLEALDPLQPRASDSIKAQYTWVVRELQYTDGIHQREEPPSPGPDLPSTTVMLARPFLPLLWWAEDYVSVEPERSRRAARLVFANWLAQADKRPEDRAQVVSKDPLVFAGDPTAGPSPADLAAYVRATPMFATVRGKNLPASFPWKLDGWPVGLDLERRTVASLIVGLAGRIYEIETGKVPATAEELVGKVLPKLPDDYVAPDGGDVQIVPEPRP